MNDTYTDKWSKYAKETRWEEHSPRAIDDYKQRVRRETVRGKLTWLHQNIEDYIVRQAKAYTAFRVGLHLAFFYALTQRSKFSHFFYFNYFNNRSFCFG